MLYVEIMKMVLATIYYTITSLQPSSWSGLLYHLVDEETGSSVQKRDKDRRGLLVEALARGDDGMDQSSHCRKEKVKHMKDLIKELSTLVYLGEGKGNLLQYSCLENSMDRGAWQATVQKVRHD